MDNFSEFLVYRNPTGSEKIKKNVLLIGGIILAAALALVSFLYIKSPISILGLLLAAGTGYGTYFFVQDMYVEYEYTFTNGDLDVDKIIAKKKRTEMLSVNVKSFTAFGKYNEELPETEDMTVVVSSDNIASHEYYADFEHEEYGKTRLIFSPSESMLENIAKFLPRALRNSFNAE